MLSARSHVSGEAVERPRKMTGRFGDDLISRVWRFVLNSFGNHRSFCSTMFAEVDFLLMTGAKSGRRGSERNVRIDILGLGHLSADFRTAILCRGKDLTLNLPTLPPNTSISAPSSSFSPSDTPSPRAPPLLESPQ